MRLVLVKLLLATLVQSKYYLVTVNKNGRDQSYLVETDGSNKPRPAPHRPPPRRTYAPVPVLREDAAGSDYADDAPSGGDDDWKDLDLQQDKSWMDAGSAGKDVKKPAIGGGAIMPSAPANATAPAGNATAPAGNATAPAGNATAPAGNATAPAGNATAPAGNATAPAGNASAPGGNATAPGGKAPGGNGTGNATAPAAASGATAPAGGNATAAPNATAAGANATAPGAPASPAAGSNSTAPAGGAHGAPGTPAAGANATAAAPGGKKPGEAGSDYADGEGEDYTSSIEALSA